MRHNSRPFYSVPRSSQRDLRFRVLRAFSGSRIGSPGSGLASATVAPRSEKSDRGSQSIWARIRFDRRDWIRRHRLCSAGVARLLLVGRFGYPSHVTGTPGREPLSNTISRLARSRRVWEACLARAITAAEAVPASEFLLSVEPGPATVIPGRCSHGSARQLFVPRPRCLWSWVCGHG